MAISLAGVCHGVTVVNKFIVSAFLFFDFSCRWGQHLSTYSANASGCGLPLWFLTIWCAATATSWNRYCGCHWWSRPGNRALLDQLLTGNIQYAVANLLCDAAALVPVWGRVLPTPKYYRNNVVRRSITGSARGGAQVLLAPSGFLGYLCHLWDPDFDQLPIVETCPQIPIALTDAVNGWWSNCWLMSGHLTDSVTLFFAISMQQVLIPLVIWGKSHSETHCSACARCHYWPHPSSSGVW